jgi:hypothetical protein
MKPALLAVLLGLGACAQAAPEPPPDRETVRAYVKARQAEFDADWERRKPAWLKPGYAGPDLTPGEVYAEALETWRRDPPSETVRSFYNGATSAPSQKIVVVIQRPSYGWRHYHHHHQHRR